MFDAFRRVTSGIEEVGLTIAVEIRSATYLMKLLRSHFDGISLKEHGGPEPVKNELTGKRPITVLCFLDRISTYYSLKPLLQYNENVFKFVQDHNYCLNNDKNKYLIVVKYFEKNKPGPDTIDLALLEQLADKYEKVIWFDDGDGTGTTHFEVLPFVQAYYKKQLLADRTLYLQEMYGREIFTDYYHRKYGVNDEGDFRRKPVENRIDLAKLKLAWNLGVGCYPINRRVQRIGVALSRVFTPKLLTAADFGGEIKSSAAPYDRKMNFAQARLTVSSRSSVGFQRKMLLEVISQNERVLTGRVPEKQFNEEVQTTRAIVSPFGWGEIAFRDFETILNRAILIKPDMDHVETYPNVFIKDETYVPVDWDLEMLNERVDIVLDNPALYAEMSDHASRHYSLELNKINLKLEEMISELI